MDYALAYNRLIAKARQRTVVDGYVSIRSQSKELT